MTLVPHHNLTEDRNNQKKRMIRVLSITVLFMVVEVIVGLISKSLALIADAGHMLTDIGAITLSLIAIWFASKPPTADKTYGYYRSEILAGFLNAFLLVAVSIFIMVNAWQRFNEPVMIQPLPVFLIALLGLVVNLFCMRLLNAPSKNGEKKSVNLKAVYLEVFGDALASIGVIISSLIIIIFQWYQADALVSGFIGIFILRRTWNLLSECTNILMEGTPAHVDLKALKDSVMAVTGVISIHDMHVWTITSGLDAMSAHILIDRKADQDLVLDMVTSLLQEKFNLNHTTIQIEQASCEKDACS
jgi:cobalt-zinc-cadmium efflux system protein